MTLHLLLVLNRSNHLHDQAELKAAFISEINQFEKPETRGYASISTTPYASISDKNSPAR